MQATPSFSKSKGIELKIDLDDPVTPTHVPTDITDHKYAHNSRTRLSGRSAALLAVPERRHDPESV